MRGCTTALCTPHDHLSVISVRLDSCGRADRLDVVLVYAICILYAPFPVLVLSMRDRPVISPTCASRVLHVQPGRLAPLTVDHWWGSEKPFRPACRSFPTTCVRYLWRLDEQDEARSTRCTR